ncbi:oxidoreductase domain-containing protein [Xylariomycetidae sp. FL2044]|nr:oxidoreductase domain-containing protein [Xylariomycetidae sp. FL2044]
MASILGFVKRNWQLFNPPNCPAKAANPLKFGILGAADIGPQALIRPAKSHPDVVIQTVAARDPGKAKAYAQKHGIPQTAESYQAILDDPDIDCVYVPLPNGLHYEWAVRALQAGKRCRIANPVSNVLLEKPSVNNAAEAEILFRHPVVLSSAAPSPPVLLEAAHHLFHPAWSAFMSYVTPSAVASATACMWIPRGIVAPDNIRFQYGMGGGALMDIGPYTASALSRIFGTSSSSSGGWAVACESCAVVPSDHDPRCDRAFRAVYRFPGGGVGVMEGDLVAPRTKWSPDVTVVHRPVAVSAAEAGIAEEEGEVREGEEVRRTRTVKFSMFVQPTFFHSIRVDDEYAVVVAAAAATAQHVGRGEGEEVSKDSVGRPRKTWRTSRTHKVYTFREGGVEQDGEAWWATYRYQLEQFVDKVRGREVRQWVSAEASIETMRISVRGFCSRSGCFGLLDKAG